MKKRIVSVNDKMQQGYRYELSEPAGRNFHPEFKPELTPKQMLRLGVFGEKYMNDTRGEFPKSWFKRAELSPDCHDATCNYSGSTRASVVQAASTARDFALQTFYGGDLGGFDG